MAETLTVTTTGVLAGQTFVDSITATGNSIERATPSIPAAKSGTLTVRTDANTGSLTMASGHGITTAQKLDVFWSGGQRRNMTVGTVATNVVPIDGGSGDDLPAAATAITAMVPVEVEFDVDGDDVVGIAVSSPKPGFVVFVDDAPADIAAATYTISRISAIAGACYAEGDGSANPLAGAVVTKVKFSHGSLAAQTMTAAAVFN